MCLCQSLTNDQASTSVRGFHLKLKLKLQEATQKILARSFRLTETDE